VGEDVRLDRGDNARVTNDARRRWGRRRRWSRCDGDARKRRVRDDFGL
jgi:hypothetical protein